MPAAHDSRHVPFLVASPYGAAGDLEIVHARGIEHVDPHRLDSAPFLDLVERLADAIYASTLFPRWAIYDCVEVPGGVVGHAVPARAASPRAREVLQVPRGHAGLVPVSMVAAVPMVEAGAWHVYGLGALDDSAGPTLELAVRVLDIRSLVGSTAWRSPDLEAHMALGRLEVLAAWMPAHTNPATLTYRVDIVPPGSAAGAPTASITCSDDAALRDLQAALESGSRFRIAGSPRHEQDEVRIPLEALGP